jgi:HK97 family phage prohead protease
MNAFTEMDTTGSPVTVELVGEVDVERRTMIVRAFEAPLSEGWDGRTLEARIVPYNQPATVADPPYWRPYQEMFLPGAFARQLSTPGRDKVLLNFEHEQGIRGVVGQALNFQDRDDGLYGSFGIHENSDGDKALQLIHSGVLGGISLEAQTLSSRRVAGVVQRVRAQLDNVSLCRYPAYQDARVLAVREEPDPEPEPEPALLLARAEDVDTRLAALGIEPLRRVRTTSKPWDGSPGRFTDEQYLRACLIVRSGDQPAKERGSLPVLEPDGTLNTNALGAAAAALAGARGGVRNVSGAEKAAAARKLIRYYNQAGMTPPASLTATARAA